MNRSLQRRARSISLLWVRLFFILSVCVAGAQQPTEGNAAAATDPVISVDVRMVSLRISVRNKKGDFARRLTERNFSVYEDNRLQTIRSFQAEDVPLAVGLVADNSGSMQAKRSDVTAAALAFAKASNPGDDFFIMNFNERAVLGLQDAKLFSASPGDLEAAIRNSLPSGKTALYDAILSALAHVRKSAIERKVLIVITDGGDNASRHTLNEVLEEIGQSDVEVYTIGLLDLEDPDANPRVLRKIAAASGGEAFLPRATADAVGICQRIAADLRAQYTIAYSPSNQEFHGEYRAIKVRATQDKEGALRVRTRAGFIASSDSPSVSGVQQ